MCLIDLPKKRDIMWFIQHSKREKAEIFKSWLKLLILRFENLKIIKCRNKKSIFLLSISWYTKQKKKNMILGVGKDKLTQEKDRVTHDSQWKQAQIHIWILIYETNKFKYLTPIKQVGLADRKLHFPLLK